MEAAALTATIPVPFDDAVVLTREVLGRHGFGVITEIDLAATFAAKLGVRVAPQTILGACNPLLAHRAVTADEKVALMLPCNVVVRQVTENLTTVSALDPTVMTSVTGHPEVAEVAHAAGRLLAAALHDIASVKGGLTHV